MTTIDPVKLDNTAAFLRAITHPVRLSIISFIDANDKTNVNKIYNTLNLEQSITSQHLAILRKTEVVHTERDGKFIYYSVNYKKIQNLMTTLNGFFAKNEEN